MHQDVTLSIVKVHPKFRGAIINGQEFADSVKFQTGAMSYRHAMRNKGQSVCEANMLAEGFVRNEFIKALNYKSQSGDFAFSRSIFHFSVALHTIQDQTSPSHTGYLPWSDNPSTAELISHIMLETFIAPNNPEMMDSLRKVTESTWNSYLNDEIPELFLPVPEECSCSI